MTNGKYVFLHLPPAPASWRSRSEENFKDPLLAGALHRMHATRQRILFADQAININSAFLQEIQRRLESTAARTQNGDLINYKPRLIDLVDFAWTLKSRLQDQRPART